MSILDPIVESNIVSVDVGEGQMTLRFVFNGVDGPVAIQLIDRTQRAQARTIEFAVEHWHDLLIKIQDAGGMERLYRRLPPKLGE